MIQGRAVARNRSHAGGLLDLLRPAIGEEAAHFLSGDRPGHHQAREADGTSSLRLQSLQLLENQFEPLEVPVVQIGIDHGDKGTGQRVAFLVCPRGSTCYFQQHHHEIVDDVGRFLGGPLALVDLLRAQTEAPHIDGRRFHRRQIPLFARRCPGRPTGRLRPACEARSP